MQSGGGLGEGPKSVKTKAPVLAGFAARAYTHPMKPPRRPKKPARKPASADGRYWMFGLHAVRAALENPARRKHRLILTRNAADQLGAAIGASGITPELSDARKFSAPLDPASVHQGAALETEALDWGAPEDVCTPGPDALVLLLDRVTDPHNVGAILRTAEVFQRVRGHRSGTSLRPGNGRTRQIRQRRAGASALPASAQSGGCDGGLAAAGIPHAGP